MGSKRIVKKKLFTISQYLHELVSSVTWPYRHNLQRAFSNDWAKVNVCSGQMQLIP